MIDDERFKRLRSAYHQHLSAHSSLMGEESDSSSNRGENLLKDNPSQQLRSIQQKLKSLMSSVPPPTSAGTIHNMPTTLPTVDFEQENKSAEPPTHAPRQETSSADILAHDRSESRRQLDQAQILRGMIGQNSHADVIADHEQTQRAFTVSITSGKGGVGKSLISLNLAVALSQLGARVCLFDANLGLGNLDLLCGLNGYWNLSHVVIGSRELSDIILKGPGGIDLVPGAGGMADLLNSSPAARKLLFKQLKQLEDDYDFLILDTGTGIHHVVRRFVTAADLVLVVTTPEPTSIADAYATIKSLYADDASRLEVLVNQCDVSFGQKIIERIRETSGLFLNRSIGSAGIIPVDPQMSKAVIKRKPLLLDSPQSPAALALIQLARRLNTMKQGLSSRPCFFDRMGERMLKRSA